jgi:hypothetical protein
LSCSSWLDPQRPMRCTLSRGSAAAKIRREAAWIHWRVRDVVGVRRDWANAEWNAACSCWGAQFQRYGLRAWTWWFAMSWRT